jgi:hypothetical protein
MSAHNVAGDEWHYNILPQKITTIADTKFAGIKALELVLEPVLRFFQISKINHMSACHFCEVWIVVMKQILLLEFILTFQAVTSHL